MWKQHDCDAARIRLDSDAFRPLSSNNLKSSADRITPASNASEISSRREVPQTGGIWYSSPTITARLANAKLAAARIETVFSILRKYAEEK